MTSKFGIKTNGNFKNSLEKWVMRVIAPFWPLHQGRIIDSSEQNKATQSAKFGDLNGNVKRKHDYMLDRFIKIFFWNFQKCRAVLCYIFIDKQMLEKVFCSNISPSLSSGNQLFYKVKYMGRSCLCQDVAITFDWSALAT